MPTGGISRRHFLLCAPGLVIGPHFLPRLVAQSRPAAVRVRGLQHMTIVVSDVKRSLDFYQGLFGMPVQARQGSTVMLRIGSGPQFLALRPAGPDDKPGFSHFGMAVENTNKNVLDTEPIMKALAAHGVSKAEGAGGGLSGGPMKTRVTMRGPDRGGAPAGTPELYLGDPDGIVIQLQDAQYCGGAGGLGSVCPPLEPGPKKGRLELRDLNHFTLSVADATRSVAFYQQLFGLVVQAHQGATPVLEVGVGNQFIVATGPAAGGTGAARGAASGSSRGPVSPRASGINHACMNMPDFVPDRVLRTLTEYGLKARGSGPAGPLVHYVSLRMPDRGGAPNGTPELYFTDPDGIVMQLQDISYCGGGGVQGNICSERPA